MTHVAVLRITLQHPVINCERCLDTKKILKDKRNKEPLRDHKCRKIYPTVSHGGYSYIFLWFCPIHGHGYGFHLIDGAEGPKDVSSSLLKYKEDMP